jgi:hypothetical protein
MGDVQAGAGCCFSTQSREDAKDVEVDIRFGPCWP